MITGLCVSDTHGFLKQLNDVGKLPDADLLIHAADYSIWSEDPRFQEELFNDFQCLKDIHHRFKHILCTAGNHDEAIAQQDPQIIELIQSIPNLHLLVDEAIVLDDLGKIKVYGSPWTPVYGDRVGKAFSLPARSDKLRNKRMMIPLDTDILITHGPPERKLDVASSGINVGCSLLRERLESVHPFLHVCGHIHGATGSFEDDGAYTINAAICNSALDPVEEPFYVKIIEKKVIRVSRVIY